MYQTCVLYWLLQICNTFVDFSDFLLEKSFVSRLTRKITIPSIFDLDNFCFIHKIIVGLFQKTNLLVSIISLLKIVGNQLHKSIKQGRIFLAICYYDVITTQRMRATAGDYINQPQKLFTAKFPSILTNLFIRLHTLFRFLILFTFSIETNLYKSQYYFVVIVEPSDY